MSITKKKISITIDEELFERYKKILPGLGMKFSTRVELMVMQDLENIHLKKVVKQ
jgi:antitoxin component of RelBE/YafQ-DinJ toxin-antitoxin module